MFVITYDVPASICVRHGYPNPDTHGSDFVDAIRAVAAEMIETAAIDLAEANDLIAAAQQRADYVPWYRTQLSDIELGILEDLAA